jgi:hypothetical protein
MDIQLLQKHFGRMGARVKLREVAGSGWRRTAAGIDIGTDDKGEFFDLRINPAQPVDYRVVDLQPRERHLLLLGEQKNKFLCGHDERHWFVCAVPGQSVTNVRQAMESLQPAEVRGAVNRHVKRAKNRLRRHNEAFVRQGEWFFIPEPRLVVSPLEIRRNEPLSRGVGSKPHMCQFAYRTAGRLVMVCDKHPAGIAMENYARLLQKNPSAKHWNWQQMRRGALLYVRGRVWHPDHQTIVLDCWHRVVMNTEGQAPGSRAVVFLD